MGMNINTIDKKFSLDERKRRLSRYDEAVRLIEKAKHILGDCVDGDEFERFLDEEPTRGGEGWSITITSKETNVQPHDQ